jgi:hypothetical protein
MVFEGRVILAEVVTTDDAVLEQVGIDFINRLSHAQCKLVEVRLAEAQTHAG